ncbi:MAG: hypothetical protein KAS32_12995, partial [Candidatus Peribacteraceae bacterium]|nr:hypothetical protein [Candidatus Peribacteraceae bacterium]
INKMQLDGVFPDIEQHSEFIPPTPEEVTDYALEQGYIIDGITFVDFYKGNADRLNKKSGWYDSNGKQVKDWKGKLRKVWFRKIEKMKHCKDAPKGFELFYVKCVDKIVVATSWRRGKPYGEGLEEDKILNKEFNKIKKS